MFIRFVFTAIILVCSFGFQAHGATAPRKHLDVSYSTSLKNHELQKLNLIIPDEPEDVPLLVWIGGGAWSYVDKDKEMDLAQKMAKGGIAVASVGHRLSPAIWQDPSRSEGIEHPAHIQDIALAVKWLVDRSDEYNFDENRVYIGGFSSGAHLAALLVSDPQYLNAHDLSPEAIQGVIAIGGSYDIQDYHRAFSEGSRPHLAVEHVEAVFGSEETTMKDASPINHITKLSTNMLLISDRNTYNYTRLYEDALISADIENLAVLHIRDLGHGPLWQHLSHSVESSYRDMIISFVKAKQLNDG